MPAAKRRPSGDETIVWEDPSPDGRRLALFSDALLAELRAHPGKWALVKVTKGHSPRRNLKRPPDIEVRQRFVLTGPAGARRRQTRTYARAKP